jgi:uncharacterized protein (DUF952 family)
MVANLVYSDATEPLVLLRINPAAVTATIQIECVDGASEHFPHIYGPLEVKWVTDVTAFERNPAGEFELPAVPTQRAADVTESPDSEAPRWPARY